MSTDASAPGEAMPSDRELALHEIRSLADQMRNANLHVYTKPQWRRDRTIGWILTVLIVSGIGWAVFYNYANGQDLRQSLYRTCLNNNNERASQAQVYRDIAGLSQDPRIKVRLETAATALAPRDCISIYLR